MTNSPHDAAEIAARLHRLVGLNQAQIDTLSLSLDPLQVDAISDVLLASLANGTLPGLPTNPDGGLPLGMPGAVANTRWVGATNSGAPSTGSFLIGDFVVARDGHLFICITAGSPGTWVDVSTAGASVPTPTAVKTSGYTAAANDLIPVDTTSGAVTVTLPSAPADKARVIVKHVVQGGSNAVTIAAAGSDVFNKAGGSTSLTLATLNQAMTLQYKVSGGIWYVVNDSLTPSAVLALGAGTFVPASAVPDTTALLAPKAVVPSIHPSKTITTFQSGHGWTLNVGAGSMADDTSNFCLGTQSVKLTTDGGGSTFTRLGKSGMSAIDVTGKQILIYVMVDNPTRLGSMNFELDSGTFNNGYSMGLVSSSPTIIQANEWTPLLFNFYQQTSQFGTPPAKTSITDVLLKVRDTGAGPVNVWVNGIFLVPASTTFPNGVVTVSFDDTWISQYTLARPVLDKYGYGATCYPIAETVGASGRMTLAQLQQLQVTNNWEMAAHAYYQANHDAGFPNISGAALRDDLTRLKAWCIANGFRGQDHFAYPGGQFNPTVEAEVKRYFSTGRMAASGGLPQGATWPPDNPWRIRAFSVSNGTSTATVQAAIDSAFTNGNWLILLFHNITASPALSTDYSTTGFTTIIDYLNTKGIPVRTLGEVLRAGS